MRETVLTLEKRELVFLAALLGESIVLGVEDPFLGWLAEQVTEEWEKSRDAMERKGLIVADESGNALVSPEIEVFVKACCSPDMWVSFNNVNGAGDRTFSILNFNISEKRFAQLRDFCNSQLTFEYGSYDDESVQIVHALHIQGSPQEENAFEIPETIFNLLSGSKESQEAHDLSLEYSNFFAALKQPERRILVSICGSELETDRILSFALIEYAGSLWSIEAFQKEKQKMVLIQACSRETLIDAIESKIAQLNSH